MILSVAMDAVVTVAKQSVSAAEFGSISSTHVVPWLLWDGNSAWRVYIPTDT